MAASGVGEGLAGAGRLRIGWRADGERGMRTLAAVSAAAALVAVVVAGIGGRLAMALLASKNPEDHGRLTDDGFVIGQFTIGGTLRLFESTYQFGLIAAVCYLAVRSLVIGPRWFQVVSLAVGAGVVVAALALVHTDGVDFTTLGPPALPIVLFVAIPVLFVAGLTVVAEKFLAADSWFQTADRRPVALLTLMVWILSGPLLPLLGFAAAVWVVWELLSRSRAAGVVGSTAVKWVARGLLSVLFAFAATLLLSDIQTLT